MGGWDGRLLALCFVPFSTHGFHLMVQDGCLSSSHHTCLSASRKEEGLKNMSLLLRTFDACLVPLVGQKAKTRGRRKRELLAVGKAGSCGSFWGPMFPNKN